jgi:RHS repeat-associated protein
MTCRLSKSAEMLLKSPSYPKSMAWSAGGRSVCLSKRFSPLLRNRTKYAYDGANRQVLKSAYVSGSLDHKEHTYYNQKWQVLEVRKEVSGTEDPDPLEQYVWHPFYVDAPLLRDYDVSTSGTQVRYYYTFDANFNVTGLTDSSGTVVERYHYTPYGQLTVLDANFGTDLDGASDVANPVMYTGQRYDTKSGLYHFRNRYIHTQLGIFIGRDPTGYDGGSLNLSEYTLGNPLKHLDAYGTNPFCKNPCIGLGCGSQDALFDIVPERPTVFGKPFTACCNTHDICYCDCNINKANCDNQFLTCLNRLCKTEPFLLRAACFLWAKTYFNAVNKAGGDSYKKGQGKGCADCDCPT